MIYGFATGFLISILCLCLGHDLPSDVFFTSILLSGFVLFFLFPSALLAGALVGLTLSVCHARSELALKLPPGMTQKVVFLEGEIVSLPQRLDQDGIRFLFKTQHRRLQLSAYHCAQDIRLGEIWRFPLILKSPRGTQNPGGFDFDAYAFQRKIHGLGRVVCRGTNPIQKIQDTPRFSWEALRQRSADLLNQWGQGSSQSGVLKALVLGDQSGITADQWRVFRATGTNHLVAISGLHIGLLFGWVFQISRWFLLFFQRLGHYIAPDRLAAILGGLAAFFYAQLAGGSIPTQRAVWMIGVCVLGRLLYQSIERKVVLVQALIVILWVDPFAVLAPGFWLSFGAVAAIFYTFDGRPTALNTWTSAWLCSFWVSWILMPLGIFWFQQISWVAPLTNVWAIPWMSFAVVPLLLWGVILGWISPGAGFLLWQWSEKALWGLLEALQWAADQVPVHSWSLGVKALIGLLVGILLLRLPRVFPARGLAWVYVASFWGDAVPVKPAWGTARVQVLDVGQGLSVVIETAHHVLIYDTGPRWGRQDAGEQILIPYLRRRSIHRIDEVILSHEDGDHVGGFEALNTQFQIHSHRSYPLMPKYNPHGLCFNGQSFHWDGVDFKILHPEMDENVRKNNASCVLQVRWGEHSLLLTGDIERTTEEKLVHRYGSALKSEILLVPHHGSRTSSSTIFLNQIQPKWAIVSAGYRNRFRLPNPVVMARYHQMGIEVWNTAETGGVAFTSSPGRPVRFERARIENRKFWMGMGE